MAVQLRVGNRTPYLIDRGRRYSLIYPTSPDRHSVKLEFQIHEGTGSIEQFEYYIHCDNEQAKDLEEFFSGEDYTYIVRELDMISCIDAGSTLSTLASAVLFAFDLNSKSVSLLNGAANLQGKPLQVSREKKNPGLFFFLPVIEKKDKEIAHLCVGCGQIFKIKESQQLFFKCPNCTTALILCKCSGCGSMEPVREGSITWSCPSCRYKNLVLNSKQTVIKTRS